MFSSAELFLLSWASIATVLAVYYHSHFKRAHVLVEVSSRIFMGIAEGSTVMTKTATGVVFTNSDEEITDEIRIQNRQG
jgi:hypothetical protein